MQQQVQGQYQNQYLQQQQQVPKKADWEIAIEKMAAQNMQFEEETRNNQKNTTASLKNLEVQLGQIAQQLASSRTPGSLPSETVQNPRGQENVNTVTTTEKKAAKKKKIISPSEPTKEETTKGTKPVIKLPYPQRMTKKEPSESDLEKFMTMFKRIEGHMALFEALERMPMYKKFVEEVMAEKKPTTEEQVSGKEQYNANSLEQNIPNKQKDPGTVTVPCTIKERTFKKVLIDSGASVNLMPLSIYHRLGIKNISDIKTNLKFADHSRKDAYGMAEDVLVIIADLTFPVDFVILDIPEDNEAPIILGRPFMKTSRCKLDMDECTLTLKVHNKEITLNAIEDQEMEEDTESQYQVGLIRTLNTIKVSPLPVATLNGKIPNTERKVKKESWHKGVHTDKRDNVRVIDKRCNKVLNLKYPP